MTGGNLLRDCRKGISTLIFPIYLLLIGGFLHPSAQAFTVNVVDQDGAAVSGFKWLLEEDNTHDPQPGVHLPVDTGDVNNNILSISIHKSHAPVVASGNSSSSSAVIATMGSGAPLAPGRYFISVLPYGDHSTCSGTYDMGGSPVTVVDNTEGVTVYVRQNPVETAQISVKVFHDIAPLNNAPDIGEIDPPNGDVETVEGFTVTLTDQGGDVLGDAFGNKIGTTYETNPDGSYKLDPATCEPIVETEGSGDFITPPNGEIFIKNLAPGKYGVEIEPPTLDGAGNPVKWYQTTTIEGTKTIDAWVRPNEPPFLVEFGPPFWHAFYGFTKVFDRINDPGPVPPVTSTITGVVRKAHLSRPPAITFFDGPEPEGQGVGERCLVGLNRLEMGLAEAIAVVECEDGTGNFTFELVPPGTYQLVVWDFQLLQIISFGTVIVPADTSGTVNVGNFAVPMWFGQQEHNVFFDANENGIREEGEEGIPEQNVNLRFRDGTIYQAFPTDTTGFVPFQSIFPFFRWQVAEVDFARFKATGLTVVNDDGGPVTNDALGEGKRNPLVASETGPVLTKAYQIFAGQNQRWEWGKAAYGPNENGGISGIVFYATTRAEDDPRLAAGEEWEPGIPRVQVNLYKDTLCNSTGGPAIYAPGIPGHCPEATAGEVGDGIVDPKDPGSATFPYTPTYADVDNSPLGWSEGGAKGPEDIDRNNNNVFDLGDATRITHTDSWDDSLPSGCTTNTPETPPLSIHGTTVPLTQCGEGLRTWNQARDGLFDGGYAFGPHVTGDGSPELEPGTYIVETATPPGYKPVKEEDRNVDFGLTLIPTLLPASCVGDERVVPPVFSFLTKDGSGDPGASDANMLPGLSSSDPDNEAPFAGETRPLCDRKKVDLTTGQNAAADFFLFTDVPKAARAVGLITDDFANEIAPNKPTFTEKFSPPWISIAVFDYTGREIIRTYGDEFGSFNWMAPSAYNVNPPTPSGIGPKMHHFCLNHPGPIPDPNNPGQFITDPRFRSQYSTTCYTFNFEAGRTTYLDTPVIRTAAFVGALQTTLDCEQPDKTPAIHSVIGTGGMPAYIESTAGNTFTITSMGLQSVPNPDFPGDVDNNGVPDDPPTEPEFLTRDYGFGPDLGTVSVGSYTFPGSAVSWTDSTITVTVPTPVPGPLATGQLTVTLPPPSGATPVNSVTLTVGGSTPLHVACGSPAGEICTGSIQDAIDAAGDGDLILVDPGEYVELPILYKRVRLQGAGAGSTVINATHFSVGPGFDNPVVAWRDKIALLSDPDGDGDRSDSTIGLLPEQVTAHPDSFLKDGEAPGIFVSPLPLVFPFIGDRNDLTQRARIDGFEVRQADLGGAIYVNAYADRLLISNNRLNANLGNLSGGVRLGNPTAVAFARGGVPVETSPNLEIDIRHNKIIENGSLKTGGGIAIYDGADDYRVEANSMCGNFARSGGAGIAHRGLSENGLIFGNDIVFNEVFQGDQPGAGLGIGGGGGGIEVAGEPGTGGALTAGTGDVIIDGNLLQGNLSGAADGGAVALRNINGAEGSPPHKVEVLNNMIVNNVSGVGGGGVGLGPDATDVSLIHNTIARNDSTATGVFAFENGPALPSTPMPGGIIARPNSKGLQDLGAGTFSVPAELRRNILWENRSFNWSAADGLMPHPVVGPFSYWDLGVQGTGSADCLAPTQGLLTAFSSPADPAGCVYTGSDNLAGPGASPDFLKTYHNILTTAAAADEGGNFVQVYYSGLGLVDLETVVIPGLPPTIVTTEVPRGDYHIVSGSSAIDASPTGSDASGRLAEDFDGEARPSACGPDTGADEVAGVCLASLPVPATLPSGNAVTGFEVWNADNDTWIGALSDGDILNLKALCGGCEVTIEAITAGPDVKSVELELSGKKSKTQKDSKPPYNLKGLDLKKGLYSLTAIPYDEKKAKGTAGTSLTMSFKVE